MNPYIDLTREFNHGGLRAIVSSGQAVVLLRLSVTSKDGDWIVRESMEALAHVRRVLSSHGARYRFGAPLDVRWMRGGWSSHFEFPSGELRIRTDFVTRPPRLAAEDLASLWVEQANADIPFVDARRLVLLKLTGRERDYAVIGELARLLSGPRDRLLASRSAVDLVELVSSEPDLARSLVPRRPLLSEALVRDVERLEVLLDAERRTFMRADVRRVTAYLEAASAWAHGWPALERALSPLPLEAAHELIVERATGVLPEIVEVPA